MEEEEEMELPKEFLFSPEGVVIDPALLLKVKLGQRSKGRGGKTKSLIYSENRGRYVKSMIPRGRVRRVAVDATLRAAAPHQKRRRDKYHDHPELDVLSRRERAKLNPESRQVYVEMDDLRAKRLARKSGALVLFVVDASGSMALNRMQAAKGAALQLLHSSYRHRDLVGVVCFREEKAELLLKPSRSMARAARDLEKLPCGGGSPLAHALTLAIRAAGNARKTSSVRRVLLVLITDARPNIPLGTSLRGAPDPEAAAAEAAAILSPGAPPPGPVVTAADVESEVLRLVAAARDDGLMFLVIDTESMFTSHGFGREIARVARGSYYYLPDATGGRAESRAVASSVAKSGVQSPAGWAATWSLFLAE